MSTNYNTCFIDSNGRDVSEEFVEKSYLLDVYENLINPAKLPALWTWGLNANGQLGIASTVDRSSPVQTVSAGTNWKQVSSGACHSAVIKTDGTLWLWGPGGGGRLGNNSVVDQSSPVQTVSAGTNWKQVSLGGAHSAAIKTDGTLWLWGIGASGRLGNNSAVNASSPVQTVSGGTNWKQVSAGGFHSGAVKTDGTLWMWGQANQGRLGNNTATPNLSSPVQTVSGGNNWRQVSLGTWHSTAIKTDGTIWLWGEGSCGKLGDNTIDDKSSPVQTISGGNNWKQLSAGNDHTAAIKTDGTLWLWGLGDAGRLGTNAVINQSSPVQTISGGNNWKQVCMGVASSVSAAIKTDGTLWLWGSNANGQLGIASTVDQSSPVQTVSAGTNWKQVVASSQPLAIREEGDW